MFYRLAAQQKTNITPFIVSAASPTVTLTTNPDIATAAAFSGSLVNVTLRTRYSGGLNSVPIGGQAASIGDEGTTLRYVASASSNAIAQLTGWDTSVGTPLTTLIAHVLSVRSRHNQTPDKTGIYSCLSDIYGLRIIPFYADTNGSILVGNKYIALSNFVVGQSVYTFRRLSMASSPVIVVASDQTTAYTTAGVQNVSTSGFTVIHRDFAGAVKSSGTNGYICYTQHRRSHASHGYEVQTPYRDAILFYVPVTVSGGAATIAAPYSSYFSVSYISTGVTDVTFNSSIPATSGDVSAIAVATPSDFDGPLFTCAQQSSVAGAAGKIRVSSWSRTAGTATDGSYFLTVLFFRDKTDY